MALAPGTMPLGTPYFCSAIKAVSANLAEFAGGGGVPSTDSDFLPIAIRIDQPLNLQEFRLYFITANFSGSSSALPGFDPGGSYTNTDGYMKSFQPSDFQTAVSLVTLTVPTTADTTATNTTLQVGVPIGETTINFNAGAGIWTQFGTVDLPLTKADFAPIGAAPNWATVQGIAIWAQCIDTTGKTTVNVTVSDLYLTGGYGLNDAGGVLAQYDYRYTNFDPRTGAEGNPSPIQNGISSGQIFLDSLNGTITVTPAAYGNSAIRQRFYRRGGSLPTNWYFVATNTGDGSLIVDGLSDDSIEEAGLLSIDNYQPISTIDASGNTILAQPVPYLWGPVQDILFAAGDPHRAGSIYYSQRGSPDVWPVENETEVCSASEQIMNGFVYAGQAYCFSRLRLYALYPNLSGSGAVTALPTACSKGLAAPWAFAVGSGGVFFCSTDGIYFTNGGEATCISREKVDTIFHNKIVNGYQPVNFTNTQLMRMAVYDNELWFQYQDITNVVRVLIHNLITKEWRFNTFGNQVAYVMTEDEGGGAGLGTTGLPRMLLGGLTSGTSYLYAGTSDNGIAIAPEVRTGARDQGHPREDKLYGDVYLDVSGTSAPITVTPLLNNEALTLGATAFTSTAVRERIYLDIFQNAAAILSPYKARNASLDFTWSTVATPPQLYLAGISFTFQPDETVQRVTNWDNCGSSSEKYSTGVIIQCDTEGQQKTVVVEYISKTGVILNPSNTPLLITTQGRQTLRFGWDSVMVDMIRLRPTDSNPWIVYGVDWLQAPEPVRDSRLGVQNWSVLYYPGDKHIKGVVLECDTEGTTKTINIEADGIVQQTISVEANGRTALPFVWPEFLGRVIRLHATDTNVGKLYSVRWIFDQEPLQLPRWETQHTDHGYPEWQSLQYAYVTYKTPVGGDPITFTLSIADQNGVNTIQTYTLAPTNGVKTKTFIQFQAFKGALFKYLFISTVGFYLYTEESFVVLQRWGWPEMTQAHPFGNDDLSEHSRNIRIAELEASKIGGGMSIRPSSIG